MRIGEFVAKAGTTKDTVRHYEDLKLIESLGPNGKREYTEGHLVDFEVIQELKSYGLPLKDIQLVFEWKRSRGCGSGELIRKVEEALERQLDLLAEEEARLRDRRLKLEGTLREVKGLPRSPFTQEIR
ncbi:MerR family transcriptional regulator [Paenibacillus sp.]|jgi:DNA-binding transcriptional MerR regulator|uniref:MerR family transcriptional regulator n=1 Tax=Paenibacillus sp. TaxID=58172 RepID=UPI002818D1AE|nr:MerR family transcriptional regulator [Paenibacillus sp.]MDR0270396.1 MerR family transcriptional regulator [Paenibacillus sp.]